MGSEESLALTPVCAQVEMHKFLAQLLRNFDVELVDPQNPWRITTVCLWRSNTSSD